MIAGAWLCMDGHLTDQKIWLFAMIVKEANINKHEESLENR
jgi:hypothetical protein